MGGCVRDLLLGVKPKDFDVATDARPDRIMDLFPRSGRVGAHFGVVLVRDVLRPGGGRHLPQRSRLPGRPPSRAASASKAIRAQDVLRRDFTINGLMMDPDTGEVLDFVDGRGDLERGIVRAIGDPDARFREDHLRLLRAIRFAARLGFDDRPATFEAIRRDHALILKVAAERVRDELVRILTEGGARRGFELLDASGMLADLLPEVAAMKGVEQPPEYHPEGDVWQHTLLLLEQLRSPVARPWRWARCCTTWASRPPSGGRPDPLRRPRGGRRAPGARHSEPAALLPRGDRAGGGADRQSHEVQGRQPHEGEHA